LLQTFYCQKEILMEQARLKELYYITHLDNLPSILERGILSHERIEKEDIQVTPIYDDQIVKNRHDIETPDGKTLWSFVNLYYQPRNPMLYRVLCEKPKEDIAVVGVWRDISDRPDIFISDGNAAHSKSHILPADEVQKALPKIKNILDMEWWNEEDGSKRKIMAECLVPDRIPPEYIRSVYVASYDAMKKMAAKLKKHSIFISPEPKMFFEPYKKINLTPNLHIVEGDMFFSRMQTLTVSVNCVGVMGKGLASKAKYQFPDVYVFYQDLCRNRTLKMGRPYIYKRETSFDYELADEPSTLKNANSETWFLLFPTKRHWRDRADIHGIEEGLKWLKKNYKKEGIKSLALPALGCGLGWLEWREVGPLICRYLSSLEIPVWLYLPTEKKLSDEELSKDFLLSQQSKEG